ncbi:hypothetical protein ANCDUO_05933 [Ancylostoma duodenale]|uniref:Uncharacterized protein n=1 Tax=Ancylostoma duodenale TaxID=51022 RepID=A0A0C2GXH6_9BILA|nr:hypothetical protein ANCDUO_05933 [Ancylostoma duodenale]
MQTPVAPPAIQDRRNPKKRPCTDVGSTSPEQADLDQRAAMLLDDDSLPINVRSVISLLMEDRKRMSAMLDNYREVHNEVKLLKSEIASLKCASLYQNPIQTSKTTAVPEPVNNNSSIESNHATGVRSFDEVERSRSIIVAGLPESSAEQASLRVYHDYNCIREIMDFLGIDCSIVAVYRLGRVANNRARLVKLVLPASVFVKMMLKHAPRLKFFKNHGIFLRASLPKSERDRLRAERVARCNAPSSSVAPPLIPSIAGPQAAESVCRRNSPIAVNDVSPNL